MSHVSDALSRAGAASPVAQPFREDDHPWGKDLGEQHRDRVHPPRRFEPVNRPATSPVPKIMPDEPSILAPAQSAAALFDPDVRQRLAMLVDSVFLASASASRTAIHSVAFAGIEAGATSGGVTAAAAELLAERTSATVCVVDAQLSAPSLHEHFGMTNDIGLANARGLVPSDLARHLRRNLWFVPAGVDDGDSSGGTDAMRTQVLKCIAQFEYVLVNIEPVAPHGEGGGFAALTDAVILVIDAETTRREAGRRIAETLRAGGAAVLGAVMTNRRFPIPERLYRKL
jgi:Mrp family chromosome partitioning ATPase